MNATRLSIERRYQGRRRRFPFNFLGISIVINVTLIESKAREHKKEEKEKKRRKSERAEISATAVCYHYRSTASGVGLSRGCWQPPTFRRLFFDYVEFIAHLIYLLLFYFFLSLSFVVVVVVDVYRRCCIEKSADGRELRSDFHASQSRADASRPQRDHDPEAHESG